MKLKELLTEVELDVVPTDSGKVKYVTKDGRYEVHSTNMNPATGAIGTTFWRVYDVADRKYQEEYYRDFNTVKGVLDKIYMRQGIEVEDEDVDPRDKER